MENNTIDRFEGEYRFLSNFYSSPIPYEGVVYPTVEHAFQAAKTTDAAQRAAIAHAPTPGEAKRLGRKVTLRSDWEAVKIHIMDTLLLEKFRENTPLGKQLVATGDAVLVEGNWWNDTFWGVCNGTGENHLGKLLMKRRDFLNGITRIDKTNENNRTGG